MKVNNAELISLLFDEPELRRAITQSLPYLSERNQQVTLNFRVSCISVLLILLRYRQRLVTVLRSLLNYEICLECEENGASNMIAIQEQTATVHNNTETKLLSIENLGHVIGQPTQEVIKLLGKAREVVHPMEDGSLMINEPAFDAVVLNWAKSFKNGSTSEAEISTPPPRSTPRASSRKPNSKVLKSELTVDDISRVKSGKNANIPDMTKKGIQQTLSSFFSKVRLDDTSEIDAISAFIEGTSEFGQTLRKKLISAYKMFSKNPDLQEVESKLVEGAKAYLEGKATDGMTAVANQE